jgi:dolichol-phosphate mannosyltransferase
MSRYLGRSTNRPCRAAGARLPDSRLSSFPRGFFANTKHHPGHPSALPEYDPSRVCVVIPARNEEKTIAEAVRLAMQYSSEVIVMDGRSSDSTQDAARDAGANVFTDPGLGKGSAIRDSLTRSNADVLVFMDADGSHDAADIPRLAGTILSDQADLCVGCRFSGGSEELSVSAGQLVRTIGNIAMNIAINHRWKVQLSDTLNGFRAVRRVAALEVGLTENRHTVEQEMVMKFLRHGYRVMNIPTHEYPREFGESHIRIWREWPMFVWCVVKNVAARDLAPRERPSLLPSSADTVEVVETGKNVARL